MKIFSDEISKELKAMLGEIPKQVNLAFFGAETNCRSCKDTERFVREFAELHDQMAVEVFDIDKHESLAKELGIDKVPSLVILDENKKDYGMRFFGIPAGYEIHSLVSAVKELGGIDAELPKEIEERIAALDKETHIKVFVTPTCPYCPGAVITGHRLAMLNDKIKADMIEANSFPDESAKYGVRGVPKIVINEEHEFVGSQPITKFLEVLETL